MTPTIPTLLPDSTAPGNAVAPQAAIASLLEIFAAAGNAGNPTGAPGAAGQVAPDFARLLGMPAPAGGAPLAAAPEKNPAVVAPPAPLTFAFQCAINDAAETGSTPVTVAASNVAGETAVAPSGESEPAEVDASVVAAPVRSTAAPTLKREVIEAIAALLAPLWQTLQPAPAVPAGATPSGETSTSAATNVEVTVHLEGVPPVKFAFAPAADASIAADSKTESPAIEAAVGTTETEVTPTPATPIAIKPGFLGKLAEVHQQIATTPLEMPLKTDEPNVTAATVPSRATVPLDATRSDSVVAAETDAATSVEDAVAAADAPVWKVEIKGAEKFAGKIRLNFLSDVAGKNAPEKNFLFTQEEQVKPEVVATGTGVAQSEDDMPALNTVRRFADDSEEPTALLALRESPAWASPAVPELKLTAVRTENISSNTAATDAAPLAHRVVETILNVADAQHNRTLHTGVVNLHFKFGSEDLAVRVQLRDGEVHTQFRTDSTELRAALADEWRAVAGQGSAGARLIEPVFAAANSGNSNGGSTLSGQNQFSSHHQNAQSQNQSSSPFALPAWRASARAATEAAPAETAARPVVALPTSLHLTAFA